MDSQINFSKIGFFVITLFILMLAFIFWLGKYGFEQQKFDTYSIFFTESVSGLNVESPIKYKGFEVGTVSDIKINPNNSEEIQIEIKINKGTPIKEDNVAVLGTLGLTGLRYIELKGGSQDSKPLHANEEGLKIIPSKASVIATLEDSTEDITKELTEVLVRTKKLFGDENLKHISMMIENGAKSMQNLEVFTQYLNKKEQHLDKMIQGIVDLTQTSGASFESMNASAQSVQASAQALQEVSTILSAELQKGTYDIKAISHESFSKLNMALDALDKTLLQTQELVESLKESPSDILFKEKAIKYGPGE